MASSSHPPEAESHWRVGLWAGLIVGWLVMLVYLWSAFATFPSAERLEQARTVRIPTLRTLALIGARSTIELGLVLALLWPWFRRHYEIRIFAAVALLTGWFLATTPLSVSAVDWVHRRWLAATMVALMISLFIALAARLVTMTRNRRARV